ncbi:MAG: hypothetical protein K2G63_03040 [Oscillospiraceae bacterium]|nr:hypothetical protein [Oscillospiraceae bacterium]
MLSTSDVTKLYFKKNFIIFFPVALILSIVAIVLCLTVFNGKNLIAFILLSVVLIALSFAVPMILAKADEKKGKLSAEIFRSEGFTKSFCESYRQAYIDSCKNPFPAHIILCASYYGKAGEHNSANMLLNRLDIKKLSGECKFVYCLEKLMACGKTGDWSEGEDIRNDNIKFIQNYMQGKKSPEYKVQMYISLALIDCAYKHYADAFGLLNFGYKPSGKNDTNFLHILITAIYIYAKMGDSNNIDTAVKNAQIFLSKFNEFEYPWCKSYYENLIINASNGKL